MKDESEISKACCEEKVASPQRVERRQLLAESLGVLMAGSLLPTMFGCASENNASSTDCKSPTTDGGPDAGATDASSTSPAPTTPDGAVAELKAGNQRFVARQPLVRTTVEIENLWVQISQGQAPFATILACADSRLSPEIIFDQFLGDIFVVREAGNIAASPTNLGSLDFSQAVLGSKLLLVLGHSACGAVKSTFDKATPGGNIQAIVDAIAPGIAGATSLDDAILKNVQAVVASIRKGSPTLTKAETDGTFRIVGAVYDIASGVVTFLDN